MYAPDIPLTVEVRQDGDAVICCLRGSATMDVCSQLNEELSRVAEHKPKVLVIDLSELNFICSLGLGSIVAAYLHARRYEGRVCLAGVQPAVKEVLDVTRLTTILTAFPTVEAAIKG